MTDGCRHMNMRKDVSLRTFFNFYEKALILCAVLLLDARFYHILVINNLEIDSM